MQRAATSNLLCILSDVSVAEILAAGRRTARSIASIPNSPNRLRFPISRELPNRKPSLRKKAKAAIIRFINQQVAAARVTTEIQNDMNNSTRTRADGKDEITKPSQRQMTENPDGSRVIGRRRPPARRDRA
jgi:hypothetical protein